MALLNNSDQIYLGSKKVDEVYLGDTMVFPNAYVYVYQTETQEIIDRAISEGFTLPIEAVLKAIDRRIIALKAEGTYWNTRDSFQLYRLGNPALQNFSRIDWKNPNGDLATDHGGGTYTVDGVKGNGVNGYRNSKFIPSLATHMTIDSIGITHILMGDYSLNNTNQMGVEQTLPTRGLYIIANYGDALIIRSNDGSTNIREIESSKLKSYGRAFNDKYIIQNTRESEVVPFVAPLISLPYYLNAYNRRNGTAASFSDGTLGLSAFGSAVSEAQHAFLKSTLNTFFTEIGIPAI